MHDEATWLEPCRAGFSETEEGRVFAKSGEVFLALAFVLVVIRPELLPGVTVNRTAAPLSVDERAAPGAANGAANIEVAADATGGAPAGGASNASGSYAAAVQRAESLKSQWRQPWLFW